MHRGHVHASADAALHERLAVGHVGAVLVVHVRLLRRGPRYRDAIDVTEQVVEDVCMPSGPLDEPRQVSETGASDRRLDVGEPAAVLIWQRGERANIFPETLLRLRVDKRSGVPDREERVGEYLRPNERVLPLAGP